MTKSQSYKSEKNFFLVSIPLINAFNYYLTYHNIAFNGRTLLTYTLDTATGYVAWAVVHLIIVYLDKRLTFASNIIRRLVIQISATVLAALLTIIIITLILHYSLKGGPIPTEFFTFDLFVISVWFLIINSVYIGLNFYRQWQAAEQDRKNSRLKSGGIKVRSGNQERLVMYGDISGFSVDESYILCFTVDAKKYVLDQSMDKIEKSLPAILFFRINRQFLLQRQVISGFERSANGRLNILLVPGSPFPSPINLSRTRAAAFKQWFHSAT